MVSLRELLEEMIKRGASDLHLTAAMQPKFRVDGELVDSGFDVLSPDDCRALAYSVLNDQQKKTFENENPRPGSSLDTSRLQVFDRKQRVRAVE